MKTLKARSVRQFLRIVKKLEGEWCTGKSLELWFRGQTSYAVPKPRIYRGDFQPRDADSEFRIEFRRKGVQFAGNRALSGRWERYFLMQHFGTPTRLLDWTDGALLGLYFAARHKALTEKTPKRLVVWVLDPFALNKLVLGWKTVALPAWKKVKPWLPKDTEAKIRRRFPIAIDPTHVDLRLAVQRSHFILFGRKRNGLSDLASRRGKKLRLARIVISGKKRVRRAVRELEIYGIRESSLFPDLEGLSREIKEEYRL